MKTWGFLYVGLNSHLVQITGSSGLQQWHFYLAHRCDFLISGINPSWTPCTKRKKRYLFGSLTLIIIISETYDFIVVMITSQFEICQSLWSWLADTWSCACGCASVCFSHVIFPSVLWIILTGLLCSSLSSHTASGFILHFKGSSSRTQHCNCLALISLLCWKIHCCVAVFETAFSLLLSVKSFLVFHESGEAVTLTFTVHLMLY